LPSEFGFRDTTRRRTSGLRRDEVAQLANIGTTTYTFIEQGRDINVSTNVLDKVFDVLRLSEEEKRQLFKLAVGDLPSVKAVAEEPAPALLTMLQNMGACPAFILNYKFDVIACNELTARVFNFPASGSELEQKTSAMTN
jgi:transcriptional regulator with XRE-family HTH domain